MLWPISINDNIKFNNEITTQPQNNLDYMIDLTFRNINDLFVKSFNVNANDNDGFPERNSFDKYCKPRNQIF